VNALFLLMKVGATITRNFSVIQLTVNFPAFAPATPIWKIHELPTSIVALATDQYYPGYTVVIAKTHATELYHLPDHESTQYFKDMLRVAKAIATAFQPQKMNYELLGNTGAHLNWHLFPRYSWDPNPRHPIWQHTHEPKLLSPEESAETIAAIRRELS
jgi:diadenosine tetraphosphate (Ap4A) HIT family hydrolase